MLDALRWKYIARDHKDLIKLNIFQFLYQGNEKKDNVIQKVWGKKLDYKVCNYEAGEEQIQNSILNMFEMIFLSVVGRIVDSESGESLKLKTEAKSLSVAPTLQKAKSIIDENVSETLLT